MLLDKPSQRPALHRMNGSADDASKHNAVTRSMPALPCPALPCPAGCAMACLTRPPGLQSWARGQMKQLRRDGADDITLVQFLMTQRNRSVVIEYVHTYLGASAQTNAFAEEFLKCAHVTAREASWTASYGSSLLGLHASVLLSSSTAAFRSLHHQHCPVRGAADATPATAELTHGLSVVADASWCCAGARASLSRARRLRQLQHCREQLQERRPRSLTPSGTRCAADSAVCNPAVEACCKRRVCSAVHCCSSIAELHCSTTSCASQARWLEPCSGQVQPPNTARRRCTGAGAQEGAEGPEGQEGPEGGRLAARLRQQR